MGTLGDRVLGDTLTNISIGSAIPLEKLITTELAKGFNHIYFNLNTLYRNFHGSFTTDITVNLNKANLAKHIDLFVEEIIAIRTIVHSGISSKLTPVFYVTTGVSLEKTFPLARIRRPSTQKQIAYDTLEKDVIVKTIKKIEALYKHSNADSDDSYIQIFDLLIKGNNTSSLIVTHYPLDLMSHASFRKLSLIESHTGNVLGKLDWVTKLSKSDDTINIPFTLLTLQVLGDGNKQFGALDKKTVDIFINLSKKYKWNPTITIPKQQFDIRKLQDTELVNKLCAMCTVKLV